MASQADVCVCVCACRLLTVAKGDSVADARGGL